MTVAVLPLQFGLVAESDTGISNAELSHLAAALQRQAVRDVAPVWGVTASVDAFPTRKVVPTGRWHIVIKNKIGAPGAAGFHDDEHGQPYALVQRADTLEATCLTASHELVEMMVDPFGRNFVPGRGITPGQTRVRYLVEACDPCEDDRYAYEVEGLPVSDFITPDYHAPVMTGRRCSFTGAVKRPRDILRGGYLSWLYQNVYWQKTWFSGPTAKVVKLGRLEGAESPRAKIDRLVAAERYGE